MDIKAYLTQNIKKEVDGMKTRIKTRIFTGLEKLMKEKGSFKDHYLLNIDEYKKYKKETMNEENKCQIKKK